MGTFDQPGGREADPTFSRDERYRISREERLVLRDSVERFPQQPEWNRYVTLTFDDSLANSQRIVENLDSIGVTNYRFYAEAGSAMRPQILRDMGVDWPQDSTRITPGKWLSEYVDVRRERLTREEYMQRYMISPEYLRDGQRIRDRFQARYPSNWLDVLEDTFGYHGAILHPDPTDRSNHIQYWNGDQIREDIETFETFMRAWLNIPEFKVKHLRSPCGGGFGFDTQFGQGWNTGTGGAERLTHVVNDFRPGATWDLWNVDSGDVNGRGEIQFDRVAREGIDAIEGGRAQYAPQNETMMLLHSNWYGPRNIGKLGLLSLTMDRAFHKRYPGAQGDLRVKKGATVIASMSEVYSSPGGEVVTRLPMGQRIYVRTKVQGTSLWYRVTWGKNPRSEGYVYAPQVAIDQREVPNEIPNFYKVKNAMESIPWRFRHEFSEADREVIYGAIEENLGRMDLSQDQYFVVADRGRQFAALAFFQKSTGEYWIVGDFGSKISTGVDDVRARSWATPTGLYDVRPTRDALIRAGQPEWRTEGNEGAGYGPPGSRVFLLGQVDVNSPYGADLTVAMHKTSASGLSQLGRENSHGCVRASDEFIDLLDGYGLMDGDYGRYTLITDSAGARHAGDNNQNPFEQSWLTAM